jgi:hypothetical protein
VFYSTEPKTEVRVTSTVLTFFAVVEVWFHHIFAFAELQLS